MNAQLACVSACTLLLLAAGAAAAPTSNIWAVLVAGSDATGAGDWDMGYGFHADTCAVQDLLVSKGVPKEHIVTMFLNDVVNQKSNPFPGQLYHSNYGMEVYANCTPDYTGSDITPKSMINILKGDAAAMKGHGTGRVLNSTADDHVVVYFSDHGGEESLVFPSGELTTAQLKDIIQTMQKNKMFNTLTLMLDACFSGTMVDWLPTNGSVYAATAANTEETASSTLCPPSEDAVTPSGSSSSKHIGACLAGEFTLAWTMEVEKADETETLSTVFSVVQKAVKNSHVSLYGDASMVKAQTVGASYGPEEGIIVDKTTKSRSATAVSRVNVRDFPAHAALYRYLAAVAADPMDLATHESLISRLVTALSDMSSLEIPYSDETQSLEVPTSVRKTVSGLLGKYYTVLALPVRERAELVERLQGELKMRLTTNARMQTLANAWGVSLKNKATRDYPADCFQAAVDANAQFCGTTAYGAQFNAVYLNACAARAGNEIKQALMVKDIERACLGQL